MTQRPTLLTTRLVLRPFAPQDAPRVQQLAGAAEIASTTLNIPHPYQDGMAEAWIATHPPQFQEGKQVTWAVTLRETGELVGAMGLALNPEHRKGELGYWIGVPYWGQGYCTEAAHAVVAYGFWKLGLNRILARHFARNPASGRVMQKIGMKQEGLLRQDVVKWGAYEDMVCYGLLRDEYQAEPGA